MTTIINLITTNYARLSPYRALTDGMAVLAVVVLLTLLVEKVLFDAYEGKPIEYKTNAFLVVTLPLLIVMAAVIFLRMAQILHYG